ncbi:hypothetical protein [Phreatobacter stygius]|uniref:DUF3617 family protein n=1 Tax=Phreatobacter stygius TaxID=1940610 RepID=A0A4D7B4K3_9HYPH|nr:hypothetical protein [Phreatobacter stygius]QCI64990.1 hypothetical protein E8M01_12625 [Phreatobacter stygius]
MRIQVRASFALGAAFATIVALQPASANTDLCLWGFAQNSRIDLGSVAQVQGAFQRQGGSCHTSRVNDQFTMQCATPGQSAQARQELQLAGEMDLPRCVGVTSVRFNGRPVGSDRLEDILRRLTPARR